MSEHPTYNPVDVASIFDEKFDDIISQRREEYEIPGISIAIVPLSRNDAPAYRNYGRAYGDTPMTSQVSLGTSCC